MSARQSRGRKRAPALFVITAVVATAFFLIPLIGLLAQTPWTELGTLLTDPFVIDALRVSLLASVLSVLISMVLGVPLAWVLARTEFRGRSAIRGLVLLPLVLPPVVGGTALLFSLGRRGFVGEPLFDATGLVLPFSIWGVVVAVTFVSMPFLVVVVEGALHNLDPRYEAAAATLGASRWTILRRVTLPMIGPSMVAGLVLTWARAIGEFGATLTFAGNLQGETQTLPLAVFLSLETDRDAAVALSLVLIVVALSVLILLRDRWVRAL